MASPGRPPHKDLLTPAEWAVVEGVRHGMTNRAIAERQGVSPDAVKFHVSNALAKLGMTSRKQLKQWDGVRVESALHRKERTMTDSIELSLVGQVARSVSDIEAAVEWYRDTLGLTYLFGAGNMVFFDCGGMRLYLDQGKEGAKPESILYFRVNDIHAAHQTLSARGVKFINAPHMIGRHDDGTEEWMAFFEDPDRRPLALMMQARG